MGVGITERIKPMEKGGALTPPKTVSSILQSIKEKTLSIHDSSVKPFKNGPRIFFWDIEIAPPLYWAYGPKVDYLHPGHLLRDKWLVCVTWKLDGKKETVSVLDNARRFEECYYDDYEVVKATKEAIENADVVVAHNGDNFDWKELQARCVYHGLGPLPPVQKIDTLKVARKHCRFHSNSLKYLAEHLGVEKKDEPPEWGKIALGDKEEIKKCTFYNRQDVDTLEKVYLKLRPYIDNHPNFNVYADIHHNICPNCGSPEYVRCGFRYTRVAKKQVFQCKACGAKFTDKKSLKRADAR